VFGGHGWGRVPRFWHNKFGSNGIVQMWTLSALFWSLRKRKDCSEKKKPRADHIRRKSAANFEKRRNCTLQNGSSLSKTKLKIRKLKFRKVSRSRLRSIRSACWALAKTRPVSSWSRCYSSELTNVTWILNIFLRNSRLWISNLILGGHVWCPYNWHKQLDSYL